MKVLFISYDGLTDNLGGSQILPYVLGLARRGHQITVLSCEKPDRLQRGGAAVRASLEAAGAQWVPRRYHKRPPILSTLFDVWGLRAAAARLHKKTRFEAVHCRSYLPALVGQWLKKRFGLKIIFDMRGFWADERVDGGLWAQNRLVYRLVYRFFKRKERQFLDEADVVISLTHAATKELLSWHSARRDSLPARLRVIPCCVDLEHFRLPADPESERLAARNAIGLRAEHLVCAYLGSLGTWYMLPEMMRFFRLLLTERPEARFLFVSTDLPETILSAADHAGVPRDSIIVRGAARENVPALLAAADFGLFFIRPCYSKISSSATKLGELLAVGLPVIANDGVGDQKAIFAEHPIGQILPSFDDASYLSAVRAVPRMLQLSRSGIRAAAEREFSLVDGLEKYASAYASVDRPKNSRSVQWHP